LTPITLFHSGAAISAEIALPSSKSESNRALLIRALSDQPIEVDNISSARDTQTFLKLVNDIHNPVWDVIDAGTTMRFLTVLAAVKGLNKIVTGTPRMCERPIGILVDALQQLGANIEYLQKTGYPPIKTLGFKYSGNSKIQVNAEVSSQFVSALAMAAPLLPDGLEIELKGRVASLPYIKMTLALMQQAGATAYFEHNTIHIKNEKYKSCRIVVEGDWSAAGYWYAMVAFKKHSSVKLKGLKANSLQGDAALVHIMEQFGVKSWFCNDGVYIYNTGKMALPEHINFANIPDQAQTILPLCVAFNHSLRFSGVESLKIKETDRLHALNTAFNKLGVSIENHEHEQYQLVGKLSPPKLTPLPFETFDDHRMAMGLSLFGLIFPIQFDAAEVVHKSYPTFWHDCAKVGFKVEY
jgi:3-phosphoshikimate 1-carboxyvinyltransferase